jgi:polysaccharide pyruvyl transferase WcaK-like protein
MDSSSRPSLNTRIVLFGHFGAGNLGNEITLQAMLNQLRQLAPNAEFTCVCSGPDIVAATHNINAVPSRDILVGPWPHRDILVRMARKLFVGIPSEVYRWLKGVKTMWRTDALVVPGTGLLTDAYTLLNWGPYDLFRWSVTAKLCRCKLLFVSVGAGPIYGRLGRLFVKTALSLADYRSYRDQSSLQYLKSIGFRAENDLVYPDLAFSLPSAEMPRSRDSRGRRSVVGIGLMEYAGKYSVERPADTTYAAYLESVLEFVKWLLAHEYDVRLVIGDFVDARVAREFRLLLRQRLVDHDEGRIVDEPAASIEELLKQLAETDLVVATRFHNVLLSFLLNKPVVAISFHHKCSSLMQQMGMAEYCQDINSLNAAGLIEQFGQLQKNAGCVKRIIRERVRTCQDSLDEQYAIMLGKICPDIPQMPASAIRG